MSASIPEPGGAEGWAALTALLQHRSPLAALQALHTRMGDVFRLPLGGFDPVVMAGPKACHFVLVQGRDDLLWRPDDDPVTQLLRRGLLVTDGQEHDSLRRQLYPALHKASLDAYVEPIWRSADAIFHEWPDAGEVDMLLEMRRLALLILMRTMFAIDALDDLDALIPPIESLLRFISPGAWLLWPRIPRPGFKDDIDRVDRYLLDHIRRRRSGPDGGHDMLSSLVFHSGLSDARIRDQLLTVLIAGHDTSTAHLSWTLWLLSQNPELLRRVETEIAAVTPNAVPTMAQVDRLVLLDAVIKESLRLYPPIHLGNRIAARDFEYQGMQVPKGQRVVYSIYLTQRHPDHWDHPNEFLPQRFARGTGASREPYTYLPFGGGPRNCIGMAFAQLESKVVLCRLLGRYRLGPARGSVGPKMGATLEPHPAVRIPVVERDAKT